MALEKDFELLDDYLSNRLTEGERTAFERKIEADPELKQELKFQQDFVQGIRNARVAELKSMLNNVPVAPVHGGQTSMLIKAGSWVVITGLVVTGLYFYFTNNNSAESIQEPTPSQQPEAKQAPSLETVESKPEAAKPHEESVKKIEEAPAKKSVEPTTKTTPEVAKKPELKVYDPSAENNDAAVQKYEQEQLELISKAFVTSSMEVETETANKKYNFHYVFKDGKLVLYGTFEQHLYEILEFINDDKRTVVLFYKTNYYLLDINKSTPTMLTPIKDRKLLKKLSEYRGD